MAELQFSRDDVEVLVGKLLDAGLEPPEQALLLAIFGVAAEQVSAVLPLDSEDVAGLHEQLVKTFLRESGDKFMIRKRRTIR